MSSVVVLGPLKPLKGDIVQARATAAARMGNDPDTDAAIPLVSGRSFVLNNNITISQSRLVLSRLDQLFMLHQLLDTIDLAPKLTSLTGKLSSIGGAGAGGKQEQLEASEFAQGFLFELAKIAAATKAGTSDEDTNVMAIVDIAGTKLGFGWRYPLALWNQLASKPSCAFGKQLGGFYYC